MAAKVRPGVVLPRMVHVTDPNYRRETYSVQQAAVYLEVSRQRIYVEAGARRLAHRRDGFTRMRFSQADLDAWRQAHRVEATAAGSTGPELEPLPMPAVRRFN